MEFNKKKQTILDRLDKAELELLYQSTEYAKQFLEDEGFNVSEETNFAEQQIKKVRFLALAVSNKRKDQKLIETAYQRLKDAIKENSQKTTAVLLSLLHSKTPSVQYRNLEKWSEEEIRDVLADIDLLRLTEELEKDQ